MAEESGKALEMLAVALEKEQKGRDFYKEAAEKCANDLGKEVFRTLMVEEGIHIKRVKEIYEGLQGGKVWTAEWKAHKMDSPDLDKLVRERISKLGPKAKGETGDVEALGIGVEMEQGAITFYEENLERSVDPLEREFITCMIAEEQSHYRALADLKLYLENPESWFAEMEHSTLDGA